MASGWVSMARDKRIQSDLTLLLVAVIWGSAFAAQRVAAAHIGFFIFNGFRFLLAVAALLPMVRGGLRAVTASEWRGGLLAGTVLAGASALQQAGLAYTTAGKAGFITGLYVVLVPLLLGLVWRQWPGWRAWLASLMAVAGLFLLSFEGQWGLAPGDGLELAGAVLWALHVILIGRLVQGTSPLRLSIVQYLMCGVLSTGLGLAFELDTLGGVRTAWWTIAYGGLISVGLGYTLQVLGQKRAPATDAAIILSLESVFAAFFGWLFLSETLAMPQLIGCVLMLAAMLVAQASAPAVGPEDALRS